MKVMREHESVTRYRFEFTETDVREALTEKALAQCPKLVARGDVAFMWRAEGTTLTCALVLESTQVMGTDEDVEIDTAPDPVDARLYAMSG